MSTPQRSPATSPRRLGTRVRRAEDARDLGRAILEATERLLADRGLDDLTVVDLIEEADVSRASFYMYFESKHAAVAALAESVMSELYEDWRPWLEGAEPVAQDVMADLWLRALKQWREHRAVLAAVAQGWRTHPDVYHRWEATWRGYISVVRDYIERTRAAGAAPAGPDATALAAVLVWLDESILYLAFTGRAPELADDAVLAETIAGVWVRAVYGA